MPPAHGDELTRYGAIDVLAAACVAAEDDQPVHGCTERIDNVVLNRWAAFPIFLGVMYLMFLISINVGSAFIDFFDLAGSALFVEGPRQLMQMMP